MRRGLIESASQLGRMLIPPAHDPMSSVFISAVGRTLSEFLDEQAGLADRTGATAVLDAAHAYQQETDWHRRHPDTPAAAKGGDAL